MSKSSQKHDRRTRNEGAVCKRASEEANHNRDDGDKRLTGVKRIFRNWGWTQTLEAIGIVVLVFYTAYTYGLLSISQEAVGLTREQVHVGQRAYILLGKAILSEDPLSGKPFMTVIELMNSGQTPAIAVATQSAMVVGPVPQVITYTFASETIDVANIGAGQTRQIVPMQALTISAEDIAAIRAGKKTLSFVGIVRYATVFNVSDTTNHTQFCLRYKVGERGLVFCPDGHNSLK